MSKPRTKPKRGRCPTCSFKYRLLKDGRLAEHFLHIGGMGQRCPGSRGLPGPFKASR